MKKTSLTLFVFLTIICQLHSREIHVAKNGNDSNSGTSSSPYKSIQRAANVAVAGDVVIIHEGTYEEILKPANSGSSGRPIVFRSATGEKVVISAMQAISGWTLDKQNVYKAYVNWDLGQNNMVLHGNKLMDLARWPNNTSGSPFPLTYNKMTSGGSNYLEYSPGIPNWNWSNGGSLHFYGAAGFLAWKEYITSTTGTRVYFNLKRNENWIPEKHNPGYTGHGRHDGEFYLQGIREALDYQNEWFYNSGSKTLYVQIEGGGKPADGAVMMRKRTQTIDLSKNYIHVENIAVFGGSIDITGNNNKIFQVSSFYGNNNLGVVQSFTANTQSVFLKGNYNVVEKCEIAYGAGSGVTDKGQNNKLLNSYVHHFDFLGNYDCVLNTRGAKNSVYKGNKLEYGGRDIIQAYGDNCEYAYNEVAWSNIVADDCGLLYTTNPRSSTSSIHHNWFHDAHAKPGRHKAAGIYLDNDSKNWDVHHNVVWNVDWTNIQINWNGTNLKIFNNTFVKASATMGAWHKAGTAFSNVKVWNNITDKEGQSSGDQESEVTWEPQSDKQNNLISKESFVNYANNDFHLKAGSPAIDYGRIISGYTDGYRGAKPDVGAFEYGDTWTAGVDWDITAGPNGVCYGLPGEDCIANRIDVTGVTIAPTTLSMEEFDSKNLSYTVLPNNATNKSVTWSSSNSTIVSVSNSGVVKGIKAGTAKVTVKTVDGGFTASCNVTVTPSTKTVFSLNPAQDAYLQGTTRFNTGDLRVESGRRTSYLMFDLSSISGNITAADLKLTVGSDAGSGDVQVNIGNSNNWTETNLSTSNAPAKGTLLASKNTNYSVGSSYTWNLDASAISGGGMLSLIVAHVSGNDVSFASKEYSNTSYKPVLTITVEKDDDVKVTGVALAPTSASILVGNTVTLSENIMPGNATNKSVTWSSSNNSVATVNNGVVTGISEGTATITVKTVDGGFMANAIVTVEKTGQDIIISHTLPTSMSRMGTTTFTISYETTTERDIHVDLQNTTTWIGYGSVVKTVGGSGTATFNFTPNSGAPLNETYRLVAYITPKGEDWTQTIGENVKQDVILTGDLPVDVTGVTLNSGSESILVGETVTLTEMVEPGNATNKSVTWSSSNTAVAAVSGGVVTGVAKGNAIITVTTVDGGFTASAVITVKQRITSDPHLTIDDTDKYINTEYTVGGTIEVTTTFSAGTGNTVSNQYGGIQVMLREIRPDWSVAKDYIFSDASAVGKESGTSTVVVSLAGVPASAELPDGNFYFLFPRFKSSDGTDYMVHGLAPITIVADNDPVPAITIEAETFSATNGTYNDGHVPFGVNRVAGLGINWVNTGDWAEYSFDVETDGEYEIVYHISTPTDGAQLQLSIDGAVVSTDNVDNNGHWDNYYPLTASSTANLTAGRHSARVTATGSNAWQWNLDKVTFSLVGSFKGNTPSPIPNELEFDVYPNPVVDLVNIRLTQEVEDANVVIYNISGRAVFSEQMNGSFHSISLDNLSSGVYIIKLIDDNEAIHQRIIKE